MIRSIRDYIAKPPPIPDAYIDGALYFLIAVFGALLAGLTEDDAYKYIEAYTLYFLKMFSKVGLAGATAIKMYRSTGFADHKAKIEEEKTEPKKT